MEKQLVIPLYLNQAYIFDMMAVIEDGFSDIRTIRNQSSKSSSSTAGMELNVDSELGMKNIFSLFSIGIKGNAQKNSAKGNSDEVQYDKVHTPASLFCKLRDYMVANSLLKNIEFIEGKINLASGDFVEFTGSFRKNPIIEIMENIQQLTNLVLVMSPESLNPNNHPNDRNKQKNRNSKPELIGQIDALIKALTLNDMVDLIASNENPHTNVIVSCNQGYFLYNNSNMVIDGNYRVLGKVVNAYSDQSEKVNLLRMTSLSRLKKETIEQMMQSFSQMNENGLEFSRIETEISGPCIQIIPIAIYA